jgi:rare lipoprotein A
MDRHTRRKVSRLALVAMLAAGLAIPIGGTAQGHHVRRFWLYNRDVRKHHWQAHPIRKHRHHRWHRRHPNATSWEHRRYHHHILTHKHRESHHRYRSVASQRGEASYYSGSRGACGTRLTGLYAAHRTWPCGTKVSVKHGKRYVIVRVLDRGPYVQGRIIDLSQSAFDRLGDLSAGTMDVRIFRLKRRR